MTPPLPTRDQLPDVLLEQATWVGWRSQTRSGDETKVPRDVTGGYASATDSATWTTFDEARAYAADGPADGVGYVFTAAGPFVGVDLDKCRDPETGQADDWAQELIDRLDSYTEVSPSGTGYHVITRGALPPGGNRTGNLELYDDARFFTVTGDHVEGTPTTVAARQDALDAIHDAYFDTVADAEPTHTSSTASGVQSGASVSVTGPGNDLTDDALIERASNAANGAKFSRLWRGDTTGYDSHSEADMALCSMLAFWTAGDAQQIDRLVRDSGLYRPKWDAVHFSDGSTYGETTIDRAIAGTTEYYQSSRGLGVGGSGTTHAADSRPATDAGTASSPDRRASSADQPPTVPSPLGGREVSGRMQELTTQLEAALDENEQLQATLEAERAAREAAEARVRELEAAADEERGGWSLFGWLRS
ncbi:bacteriophage-like protein [Haloferax sp. ATB1]|uniref:phage NrS-1 polymerase family protein n=1 Tax=Haloferax sp. ATB1 TaxID=1508454 RepID=UPI0005B235F7|nr:bacteriophage-like protein [Haloferax sp. ATB1]